MSRPRCDLCRKRRKTEPRQGGVEVCGECAAWADRREPVVVEVFKTAPGPTKRATVLACSERHDDYARRGVIAITCRGCRIDIEEGCCEPAGH